MRGDGEGLGLDIDIDIHNDVYIYIDIDIYNDIDIDSPGVDIDVRGNDTKLENYSATLVHKACHSFSPNSTFQQFSHPRSGDTSG